MAYCVTDLFQIRVIILKFYLTSVVVKKLNYCFVYFVEKYLGQHLNLISKQNVSLFFSVYKSIQKYTKAIDSSSPEEAGWAMLSYRCPGRVDQKTKFFSRAVAVQWLGELLPPSMENPFQVANFFLKSKSL